jgi:hypothetical protein
MVIVAIDRIPVSAEQGEQGVANGASPIGRTPGVYVSPSPSLDSRYNMSSASTINFMYTCLLRATFATSDGYRGVSRSIQAQKSEFKNQTL